ncbi:MAG: hypothetical protein R3F30_11105 [Planctomycetota bacterium]
MPVGAARAAAATSSWKPGPRSSKASARRAARAALALGAVELEQEDAVGPGLAADLARQPLEHVERHAADEALVDPGRQERTVEDEGLAAGEAGHELLDHEGAAAGREQQGLDPWVVAGDRGVEHERADELAEAGPAGLAQQARGVAAGAQRVDEPRRLHGLAGAVGALEGQQQAAAPGHRRSSPSTSSWKSRSTAMRSRIRWTA